MTLPLAWLVSVLTLIAGYTLFQTSRTPLAARLYLCGFLVTLAVIGGLVGLRLTEGAQWAARLQPLVAVIAPPLAYAGFLSLTQEDPSAWKQTALWNLGPILLVQIAILLPIPVTQDLLVIGMTAIYLVAFILLQRRPNDAFVHVPPHAMPILRGGIYVTMVLFVLTISTDSLIAVAMMLSQGNGLMRYLSASSGLLALFVVAVALIGTPLALRSMRSEPSPSDSPPAPTEDDTALLAALDVLLREKQLYQDNNLTLARLARRMSVPARDISNATNRGNGENFSRYINGYRIEHAKRLLRETALPVTEVMLDSGFVSKSSFNTEFRRITGQTPSQFRAGPP